jgi:hypothetical protein
MVLLSHGGDSRIHNHQIADSSPSAATTTAIARAIRLSHPSHSMSMSASLEAGIIPPSHRPADNELSS